MKILRSILLVLVFFAAVMAAIYGSVEAAEYTGPDIPTTDLVVGAAGYIVAGAIAFVFAVRNFGERI